MVAAGAVGVFVVALLGPGGDQLSHGRFLVMNSLLVLVAFGLVGMVVIALLRRRARVED